MLTRRVNLAFPIELPGGTISTLTAHPISAVDFRLMHESDAARWQALANCVRLPVIVVQELDCADIPAVVDAIASLSGEAQAAYLAHQRGRFTVHEGDKQ